MIKNTVFETMALSKLEELLAVQSMKSMTDFSEVSRLALMAFAEEKISEAAYIDFTEKVHQRQLEIKNRKLKMEFNPFADVLPQIDDSPRPRVRAKSLLADSFENKLYAKQMTYKDISLRFDAALKYNFCYKKTGKGKFPLGQIPLAILELFSRNNGILNGKAFPSIAWIAKKIRCSSSAISKGLKKLQEHGFLSWERRYVRTNNIGKKGPQIKQTSNAYYLLEVPKKAHSLLGRYWMPAHRPTTSTVPPTTTTDFACTSLGQALEGLGAFIRTRKSEYSP